MKGMETFIAIAASKTLNEAAHWMQLSPSAVSVLPTSLVSAACIPHPAKIAVVKIVMDDTTAKNVLLFFILISPFTVPFRVFISLCIQRLRAAGRKNGVLEKIFTKIVFCFSHTPIDKSHSHDIMNPVSSESHHCFHPYDAKALTETSRVETNPERNALC